MRSIGETRLLLEEGHASATFRVSIMAARSAVLKCWVEQVWMSCGCPSCFKHTKKYMQKSMIYIHAHAYTIRNIRYMVCKNVLQRETWWLFTVEHRLSPIERHVANWMWLNSCLIPLVWSETVLTTELKLNYLMNLMFIFHYSSLLCSYFTLDVFTKFGRG